MTQYYLAKGDRAGNAEIIEGLDKVTSAGVPVATLGMKTMCSACNEEGQIIPQGSPLTRPTAPNGKPFALSGDLNACKCGPGVFRAKRGLMTGARPNCQYVDGSDFIVSPPFDSSYKISNKIEYNGTEPLFRRFQNSFGPEEIERPVLRHNWTVNGHPVGINVPTNPEFPYGGRLFPLWILEEGLKILPTEMLSALTEIDVSSVYSGHLAAASGSRIIATYLEPRLSAPFDPIDPPVSQFMGTLLHEATHVWDNSMLGASSNRKYHDAISKDNAYPSEYAKKNSQEDFAEFSVVYWASRGTPCETKARSRYPNRYAYFDSLVMPKYDLAALSYWQNLFPADPTSDEPPSAEPPKLPTIDQGQSSVTHSK